METTLFEDRLFDGSPQISGISVKLGAGEGIASCLFSVGTAVWFDSGEGKPIDDERVVAHPTGSGNGP